MPVLYLLTATSAADAVARMSLLTEMNRRDGLLARRVQETQEKLSRSRAELVRLQRARELALQQLAIDRAEMRERMAESRRLYAALQDRQDQILLEISRVRPFAACPVDGPHAIADDFGIWVHHTKEDGGDHVHQGNDIIAPSGTPIVAPFDGVAVTATNKIGGLAVKVFGDYGYVYNAHLSRYGNLGPVETGDVIGYVGATGNAGRAARPLRVASRRWRRRRSRTGSCFWSARTRVPVRHRVAHSRLVPTHARSRRCRRASSRACRR